MKQREIRIGLVGFGAMGKTHAFAVQGLPFYCEGLPFRASIAGVVTRSIEKSRAVAAQYGIPIATTDEDELINNPTIDVIDICTPNILHAATAKKALAAGKHVYCEKPLADNEADAAELATLAAASGCVCTVVFNNRHLAAITRARQLIDEGRIGRILSFDFSYLHNSCIDPDRTVGWKQDATVCGNGGVLYDLGAHALDLAVYLCGRFRAVSGRAQIAYPTHLDAKGESWTTNAPEAFYITAETESGAIGTVTVSKLHIGTNDELSFAVYGERGALRFSLMDPNFLEFYDATASGRPIGGTRGFTRIECVGRYPAPAGSFPAPKAASGWLRGHVMSMYHFLDAVYRGKQNAPSFADGAYVQHIMDTALAAAADGTWRRVE